MGIDRELMWELFHFAILSTLLAGLVCPLLGAFLLVRRTGFYGVTLPQFAAAGVAFGFAILPWWIANVGLHGLELHEALESAHALMNYHLSWAAVFTAVGLALLGTPREGRATEAARMAASFAVASALIILFGQASPTGMEYVEALLRGEVLLIDVHKFETIVVAYGLVLALVVVFHRDLTLVSFDPETSRVIGKSIRRYEALLIFLTGTVVSIGVWVVGPIVLFGLLVLPPLAAHFLARSMISYLVLSSALGLVAAGLGCELSFRYDWPLGPCVVVAAAAELVPCWGWSRLRRA